MRRLLLLAVLLLAGCGRFAPADTRAAEACINQRDYACAERVYRDFLAVHPGDARRSAMLALVLTRRGKHADALPFYETAEASGLRTYDIYANHAFSLDAVGRTQEAMAFNRRAIALVPQLVDARGHLAEQLVRVGRREEAIQVLEVYERQRQGRGEEPYFADEIIKLRRGEALEPVFGEDRPGRRPSA
jgi:tetratricopeptide (TPR) repeat protein